ncbi:lithostathine-2-like [Mytilus californianus]|uniref:lithostathine-2-like n=1 Tax=Mytilus californianus TaxID=6549 RepID=UPI002247A8F8|nr:lithostathine-2-like [Mytilus californianus]
MTRAAMVTLLVIMCMALIVEVKSIHGRKGHKCRAGWRPMRSEQNKFCYYFSADSKTQGEARAICKRLKGNLFYPTDSSEIDRLFDRFGEMWMPAQYFWTGGYKVNYEWTWGVNPFKLPFLAPNWAYRQPNGEISGECIAVNKLDKKMYDERCESRYKYVCKESV